MVVCNGGATRGNAGRCTHASRVPVGLTCIQALPTRRVASQPAIFQCLPTGPSGASRTGGSVDLHGGPGVHTVDQHDGVGGAPTWAKAATTIMMCVCVCCGSSCANPHFDTRRVYFPLDKFPSPGGGCEANKANEPTRGTAPAATATRRSTPPHRLTTSISRR